MYLKTQNHSDIIEAVKRKCNHAVTFYRPFTSEASRTEELEISEKASFLGSLMVDKQRTMFFGCDQCTDFSSVLSHQVT